MDDEFNKARVIALCDETCLGIAKSIDDNDDQVEFLIFEQNHCYHKNGNEMDMDDVKINKLIYLDDILLNFPKSFLKKIFEAVKENPTLIM